MLSTKKNNSSSKGGSVSRRANKKRKRRGRVVWKPKVVVWEEGGDRLSRGRRSKAQGREKRVTNRGENDSACTLKKPMKFKK